MRRSPDRFDHVSVVLHWGIAMAIIAIAAIELLRGELSPKGSFWREALKALHEPAGTVAFALIFLRLMWRLIHPAPPMPLTMRPWEKMSARGMHLVLYAAMVALPLTGLIYSLARGRPIDFGLFQIAYPLDAVVGRSPARTFKEIHEFLGQAILILAFVHAAAALWHHHVRKDGVLVRMLPRFKK